MARAIVNKSAAPDTKLLPRRAIILLGAQMLTIGVLGWRMRKLQIEDSERYRLLAEENRVNIRIIPPRRGLVFDNKGNILAHNQQNYRIVIIREEAKNSAKVLSDLAKIIPLSKDDQTQVLSEIKRHRAFVPVKVVDNLTWEQFAQVAANSPSLPGLIPEVGYSRFYIENEVMAHLVGYVGPVSKKDLARLPKSNPLFQIPAFNIGKTGVERELNSDLMGIAGVSRQEVNASGRVMRELERNKARSGVDIQLTVNTDLQRFAMARMANLSASAVVLELKTGNIVAMASTPSFNPNEILSGISQERWSNLLTDLMRPLSNKSVSDAYPPASLFKMVVAIAALENGVVSKTEKVDCSGVYEIGDSRYHCWSNKGHGFVNLERAIERSCDVYFYEIAKRVGIDSIAKIAKLFGLATNHPLPVSAISKGLIPTTAWKRNTLKSKWVLGDTLNAGIGQGYVLATPLQIAVMTARIATGTKVEPRLINAKGGARVLKTIFNKIEVSSDSLNYIRDSMVSAVNNPRGTGYQSRIFEPANMFSGKTGTAQVRRITAAEREKGVTKNENLPWEKRDHALFTGFAPSFDPKYSISVIVEHGGSASKVAAPIARDIMLFALHDGIPPITAYPPEQREKVSKKLNKILERSRSKRENVDEITDDMESRT
ncbi:MAG: penicillin-binding protein 2 [Pseudomonadota bacterium]|nr:penicillin-binding protein 2 [Pseudomonadota bacterium]